MVQKGLFLFGGCQI